MIRDYGRNNDLTSAADAAKLLNDPSRQPKEQSWVEHREAIVLPPVKHEYEPVSAITGIKKFSCFVPVAHNRTAMKLLPCARPCCITSQIDDMMTCRNRAVTGWFDEEGTGKLHIHYRIKEPKRAKIVIHIKSNDKKKSEMTLTDAELKKLKREQEKKKKQAARAIKPKQRRAADTADPKTSAQSRKGRLPTKRDLAKYKNEHNDFRASPNYLREKSYTLLLGPAVSPLRASKPASAATPTPVPAVPATPAAALPASKPTTIKAKRGRPTKKRRHAGPGRPKKPKDSKKSKKGKQ